MEHIFVLGAYFTTDKNDTDMYPFIANLLKNKFPSLNVVTPINIEEYRESFIKENSNASIEQINKAMVDYDLKMVRTAKMLIVDISNKSTGLGIELGTIARENKPIIFVARKGSQISNMVYGAFPTTKVNYYNNKKDLEAIINSIEINNVPRCPKIVTLCGSFKFAEETRKIAGELTAKKGYCVIQYIYDIDPNATSEEKANVSTAHYKKIDISDAIYVVNIGGYIGSSTRNEINYALSKGKEVLYHEEVL